MIVVQMVWGFFYFAHRNTKYNNAITFLQSLSFW